MVAGSKRVNIHAPYVDLNMGCVQYNVEIVLFTTEIVLCFFMLF